MEYPFFFNLQLPPRERRAAAPLYASIYTKFDVLQRLAAPIFTTFEKLLVAGNNFWGIWIGHGWLRAENSDMRSLNMKYDAVVSR
jgi:hypothetical protein